MLAHVPLFAHGEAEQVLVVGGGDGGMVREVLRHASVKKVVLVEVWLVPTFSSPPIPPFSLSFCVTVTVSHLPPLSPHNPHAIKPPTRSTPR